MKLTKLTILFSLLAHILFAQTYPVTVNTIAKPPYPVYFSEYASGQTDALTLNITFNDFTEASWDIYFSMSIQGNGISITSKPGFKPVNPLTVYPGQVHVLSGDDLYPYFNLNNLNFEGITATDLQTDGRLPEGPYTFCFTALDYNSGKALSAPSCASAFITLYEAPVVITPQPDAVVPTNIPLNINFNWQIPGIDPTTTEYQLNLYELPDFESDPSASIENNLAYQVYQSDFSPNNWLLYDINYPALEPGKAYAFRIKAQNIDGKANIKNDGFSIAQKFTYGYPLNGTIELTEPADSFAFDMTGSRIFRWNAPDNLTSNQLLSYQLKIVQLPDENIPEDLSVLEPYYEYTTSPVVTTGGYSHNMNQGIEQIKNYAWQVKAFTEELEVAKSEIRLFTGPPVINGFYAANVLLMVTKTFNTDLNNLVGKCLVPIDSAGINKVEASFNNISIENIGGRYVMTSGSIIYDFEEDMPINLIPENEINGEATFMATGIQLFTNNYKLKGYFKWDIPLAVNSDEPVKIISDTNLVSYVDFKIINTLHFSQNAQFEILEPTGTVFNLQSGSKVIIYNNQYTLFLNGTIEASMLESSGNQPVLLPFTEIDNVNYFSTYNQPVDQNMKTIQNTGIEIQPISYIFDFSDIISPTEISNPSWKGIDFKEFNIIAKREIDAGNQLQLNDSLSFPMDSIESTCFVSNEGLSLVASCDFQNDSIAAFNQFPAWLSELNLNIANGIVSNTSMNGGIKIPVLSNSSLFDFSIPLTNEGFMEGYLTGDLSGATYPFNEEGGDQKLNITINRAVFENNNALSMNINIEWPSLEISLENLEGFKAFGNYEIGFGDINGTFNLVEQYNSQLYGYEITIDQIGCGRQGPLYAFGTAANVVMGEDVSGPEGAPKINLYSIAKNTMLSGSYTTVDNPEYANDSIVDMENYQASDSDTGQGDQTDGEEAMEILNEATEILNNADNIIASTSYLSEPVDNNIENLIEVPEEFNNDDVQPADVFEGENITIEDIIEIVELIKPLLDEESQQKADQFIEFCQDLSENELKQMFEKGFDVKKIINSFITDKANKAIIDLLEPLNVQRNNLKSRFHNLVEPHINEANDFINDKIDVVINTLKDGAITLAQNIPESDPIVNVIEAAALASSTAIKNEINTSLNNAVSVNILQPFDSLIDQLMYTSYVNYLQAQVDMAAQAILYNAEYDVNEALSDLGDVLQSNADALFDALKPDNIANQVMKTGKQFIAGVNWEDIRTDIFNNLGDQFMNNVLAAGIDAALGNLLGPQFAESLLSNIDLDFSDLGSKLKNGEIDEIIKFDPTNITIESRPVDLQGFVKFTKDDSVWGDSWQAELNAFIKIPDETKAIAARAFFLNGTTTQPESFKYWFVELGVDNMNVPLSPIPMNIYGIQGRVYRHMARQADETYLPDQQTKYGAGVRMWFYDARESGKIFSFDLGLDLAVLDTTFMMEFNGNAFFSNTLQNPKEIDKSLIVADGFIRYTSNPRLVLGEFNMQLQTQPLMCAGGQAVLFINEDSTRIAIGTRENPFALDFLCRNNPQFVAWMDLNNVGLDMGMQAHLGKHIQSPWLNFGVYEVQAWAEFYFDFETSVIVYWDPFEVEKAYLHLNLVSGIGIDYKGLGQGTLTFAAVNLGGTLLFTTQPDPFLAGSMHGSVTVLNFNVGFDMNAQIDL